MLDQNFGHKELYEVVLRAKSPMDFGDRHIVSEEPVLYFDNIQMSLLSEQNRPIFARGGWDNLPRVIWDDRSEVQFSLTEGVMSSVGMSILLSSQVLSQKDKDPFFVNIREGPFTLTQGHVDLRHWPTLKKKVFIFNYSRNQIQEKMYGRLISDVVDPYGNKVNRLAIYQDKNCTIPAENSGEYIVDYYYEYEDDALIYSVEKERFNGLFSLEAKFYSKDENEGRNYTNVLYMPKVRIVSNINLRLGERANPAVSNFSIIGMPETVGEQKNLIMEITRLGQDIDADI